MKGRKQLRFSIDFKGAVIKLWLKELQKSCFQRSCKIEFLPDFGKAANHYFLSIFLENITKTMISSNFFFFFLSYIHLYVTSSFSYNIFLSQYKKNYLFYIQILFFVKFLVYNSYFILLFYIPVLRTSFFSCFIILFYYHVTWHLPFHIL